MDQTDLQEQFLEEDAPREHRWQALRLNNESWFARCAQVKAKEVVAEEGIMWTSQALAISAVNPLLIGDQLDRAMEWYRAQQPLEGVICWYLTAHPPGDLAACLLARGFSPNWQPHWMWCDLRDLADQRPPASAFAIQTIEDEPVRQAKNLPYYPAESRAAREAIHRMYPRQVRSLAAFQKGRAVGRCVLNITTGAWGIAGLFAMGVAPAARKQGIGTALAWEACHLARQIGCHHVVLNATAMGEPVYRRVGFQSMAHGPSWHLDAATLAVPPLAPVQVSLLEAVGQGEVPLLDELSKYCAAEFLHNPLPNGLTPLDIAVHCQQPASADWLIAHGVRLDLLSAWDLGWRERFGQLLTEQPELVNRQSADRNLTLLHIAAERGDTELARVLLTVPNDLELKDSEFESTALGWAQYFQRPEIVSLIEQHHR
jgi:GNAT superfamily N-acetyltransferase